MDSSTKRQQKLSLTLSNRLHQKRHSASPQSRVNSANVSKDAPSSPTALQLKGSLENVECTPPHKKTSSLDDSVDFSPRLDISLSPNCLFSQTLAADSPEVSWRWNHTNNNERHERSSTTDSGFDSAESIAGVCTLKEGHQLTDNNENKYMARRHQLDNEQWRAQQIRARELLKERCDKLHRQLAQITTKPKTPKRPASPQLAIGARTRSATKAKQQNSPPASESRDAALNDFLNDSDTDCFLLMATQQLESKLDSTQPARQAAAEPAVTTPTSHRKEQRPSYYMKFLEDETETDDWLAALDEAVLEATNPKKPRMSLQRYKSMPTTTTEAGVSAGSATVINVNNGMGTAGCKLTPSSLADTPRMKRHASSHALSPVAPPGARGKLFDSRK